ncbi:hypothetical protein M8C21_028790, partial [Ambrosia artemisiifolia]
FPPLFSPSSFFNTHNYPVYGSVGQRRINSGTNVSSEINGGGFEAVVVSDMNSGSGGVLCSTVPTTDFLLR